MTIAARASAIVGPHRTRNHLYYFDGQGPWPGVTTVTKVLDAPALTNWKLGQVAEAAVANAERLIEDRDAGKSDAAVKWLTTLSTSAMDRGSRIHAVIECVLRREPYEVDERDEDAISGVRDWLNTNRVRPIAVEAFLLNPEAIGWTRPDGASVTAGYGGTCDLIAEIDGETWLLDWKTGRSVAWPTGEVYSDHRLQLAAYGHAAFLAKLGDPVKYPVPTIDRYGIVHVTDGGTRLYEANVTDEDWVAFRSCLRLHEWRKSK